MKKLLLLLAAVGMVFTACEQGGGLDENGNGDNTEPTAKIATIEEQGANIKATLVHIETTKNALNKVLVSLKEQQPVTRGNDNDVKEQITNIEGQINALEDIIIRLTAYMGGELAEITDWANATFATLEQQEALAAELAALKVIIAELDTVSTAELIEALAASEQSMKQWVNEQLAGYATLADVDAQIAALKAALTEESEAERQEIEALIAELKTLQEATEASYKEAIASAIQNQGVINEQIAADIAAVNKRIDEELATINSRLDEIEARLDKIEETIKDLVNRIQSVSLVKSGSDAVKIITSAELATVTLNYEISPKSTIDGLALKWEEYVKVKALYDGKELVFVDMPITSFSANAENGIVTVTVSGENLSAEFYTDLQAASLRMEISDGNNDKRSEYTPIVPQRWYSEGISMVPANDELYYITADGNTLVPTNANNKTDTELFGANIVSNLYDWQKGCFVFKFDGEITTIGQYSFGIKEIDEGTYQSTLKYLAMPNSVTKIASQAFAYCCDEFVSIVIPDSVIAIGRTAFGELAKLESVTLGKNVASLGDYSFSRCSSLKEINIPEKITEIPNNCFRDCESLKSIALPDGVVKIGSHAFANCTSLKSVDFGQNIESIGSSAFAFCKSIKGSITLPQSLKSIGTYAFQACQKITSVYLSDNLVEVTSSPFMSCIDLEYFYGKCASSDNRCFILDNKLINVAQNIPAGEYALPDGITSLEHDCISYPQNPIVFVIPESVTDFAEDGFITGSEMIQGFKGKFATEDGLSLIKDNILYGFAAYGVTKYAIPEGVTKVAYRPFNRIDTLEEIVIPSTFKTISGKFVDACKNLKSVYCNSVTPPAFSSDDTYGIFYGMENVQYYIYVPLNSVPKYKAAEGWKDYADKIQGIVL